MIAGYAARGRAWPEMSRALVYALVVAAVAEMILMRVIYRVGVHIPRSGAFLDLYGGATHVGLYAFNLAALLAIVVLVVRLPRPSGGGLGAQMIPAATLALAVAAVVMVLWPGEMALRLVFALLADVLVVAGAVMALRGAVNLPSRLALGLALGAALAFQYYALGSTALSAIGSRAALPGSSAALRISEACVLAAAAAAFWAWGPRFRRAGLVPLASGAAAVLVFGGAQLANPSTTSILALWAVGLTLSLPAWAYAIALGAFVATVARSLGDGRARILAAGLTLLLAAGAQPLTTYQYLLLVIAFGLLAENMLAERARAGAEVNGNE